jgi:hypothetical protein
MNPATAPQPSPSGTPDTPAIRLTEKRRDREMFLIASGLLREYADKLDRLVTNTLTARDRQRPHEPVMPTALVRFTEEFDQLERPLRKLINLGSAIHEEGRVNDLQKLELDLRLTEIEGKYETARVLFAQLRPMLPSKK